MIRSVPAISLSAFRGAFFNYARLSSGVGNFTRSSTFFKSSMRSYSTQKAGGINEIADMAQLKHFLAAEDKVSVIDFYAVWCGPCKALEPIFQALAQKVPEVQFGRVDVDQASDVATEYGVSAMPTCLFFKNGEKVDSIIGANPQKLVALLKEHAGADATTR